MFAFMMPMPVYVRLTYCLVLLLLLNLYNQFYNTFYVYEFCNSLSCCLIMSITQLDDVGHSSLAMFSWVLYILYLSFLTLERSSAKFLTVNPNVLVQRLVGEILSDLPARQAVRHGEPSPALRVAKHRLLHCCRCGFKAVLLSFLPASLLFLLASEFPLCFRRFFIVSIYLWPEHIAFAYSRCRSFGCFLRALFFLAQSLICQRSDCQPCSLGAFSGSCSLYFGFSPVL